MPFSQGFSPPNFIIISLQLGHCLFEFWHLRFFISVCTADLTQRHRNSVAGGCRAAYPTVHLKEYIMS